MHQYHDRYRRFQLFPGDLARAQCACVPVENMCAVNGKMADRYRSSLWNFFKICIEDESKATCDVCKQKYSRGGKKIKGYTTSNLKKHLEQCHPDEFKKMEEQEKEREAGAITAGTGQSSKQVSLDFIVEKQKQLAFDHPRARRITSLIAEMIVVDNQPLNIVNDVGFVRLLNYLEPRYNIPSRKYISDTLIPEMYENVKKKLDSILKL